MRYNFNQITVTGRLTKDPEFKPTTDSATLTFKLAVERSSKGDSQADFIPVRLWGGAAVAAEQFLIKGCPVLISGRLQVSEYEKDDQKKWFTEIIGDTFQVLDFSAAKQKAPSEPIPA